MNNTYEIDNFNNMQEAPAIFFRYIIHMLTFLISIYIVHLNFSIVNALIAMVLIIVSEIILEAIAHAKYSKKKQKVSMIKRIFAFIDIHFHYVILLLAFCFRLFWYFKLNNIVADEIWIHILNCLCGSIVTLFIYLISKELFSKRAGQIVALLYSTNIFVSAYCSVLTNQHVFAVLILIAMYLLIAKKYMSMNYIVKHVIVALLLATASVLRLEGIIYLFAVIIYLFANSLVKNNGKKEKLISIAIIMLIYVLVNAAAFGVVKIVGINDEGIDYLATYKEMFKETEMSIKQFEINSKDYWNSIDYGVISDKLDMDRFKQYDTVIFLYCAVCSAIIVIYCKLKNVEDERMYLPYLIILINFFVYGFVSNNSTYSYVAKIMLFILASGCLAILKKGAETDAMKQNEVKLLQD